jgi:histidine ammonia-lyase
LHAEDRDIVSTYEVAGLSASAGEDENGLGASASSSLLELIPRAKELASLEMLAGDKGFDLSVAGFWSRNGGGSGQRSEKGGGKELHFEGWIFGGCWFWW